MFIHVSLRSSNRITEIGTFLGCTEYPNCEYKKWIEFEHGECPSCGSALRLIEGPKGAFLGCSDYPDCHFTENISFGNHNIDYGNCPQCGYPLVK